eukprot:tig00000663_g2934.t1
MTLRRFSLGSLGKQDIRLLARLRSQNFSFSRYHPLQRSASEKDLNRLVEAAAPRSARTRDGARKPRRRARSLPAEPGKELPTLLEELRRYYERGRQRSEWVYTQKDLLLRESIRFDPGIAGILSRFWRVTDEEGLGRVSKAEYLKFHNLLYKALNKHFDAARAAAVAEEDWELDSGAHDELNADRFRLSLFEMADAWAGEVTAGEYARVLEIVFERITYLEVGPRGTRRRLRYRALEEVAAGEAATASPKEGAEGPSRGLSRVASKRASLVAGAGAAPDPARLRLLAAAADRLAATPAPSAPAPPGSAPAGTPLRCFWAGGAVAGEAPSPLGPHALPGQKVASAAAGFKLKLPLPPAIAPPAKGRPPPPSPPPSRPPRPAPRPARPAPRHPLYRPSSARPRAVARPALAPPAPGPVIRPLSAGTGRQSGRAQLLARAGGAAAVLERGGCLPPRGAPPTRIPPRPCSSFPGPDAARRPPRSASGTSLAPHTRRGGGGPAAAASSSRALRPAASAPSLAYVAALERQWRAAANLPQRAREAAERLAPAAARLVESLRLATRAPLHTLPPPPPPLTLGLRHTSETAIAARMAAAAEQAEWATGPGPLLGELWHVLLVCRWFAEGRRGRRAGPRPEEDVRDVGLFLAAAFDAARAASPTPAAPEAAPAPVGAPALLGAVRGLAGPVPPSSSPPASFPRRASTEPPTPSAPPTPPQPRPTPRQRPPPPPPLRRRRRPRAASGGGGGGGAGSAVACAGAGGDGSGGERERERGGGGGGGGRWARRGAGLARLVAKERRKRERSADALHGPAGRTFRRASLLAANAGSASPRAPPRPAPPRRSSVAHPLPLGAPSSPASRTAAAASRRDPPRALGAASGPPTARTGRSTARSGRSTARSEGSEGGSPSPATGRRPRPRRSSVTAKIVEMASAVSKGITSVWEARAEDLYRALRRGHAGGGARTARPTVSKLKLPAKQGAPRAPERRERPEQERAAPEVELLKPTGGAPPPPPGAKGRARDAVTLLEQTAALLELQRHAPEEPPDAPPPGVRTFLV